MNNDLLNLQKKCVSVTYLRTRGSMCRSISGSFHDAENKNQFCENIREIPIYK